MMTLDISSSRVNLEITGEDRQVDAPTGYVQTHHIKTTPPIRPESPFLTALDSFRSTLLTASQLHLKSIAPARISHYTIATTVSTFQPCFLPSPTSNPTNPHTSVMSTLPPLQPHSPFPTLNLPIHTSTTIMTTNPSPQLPQSPHPDTPQWMQEKLSQALSELNEIQRDIARKENELSNLQLHLSNGTVPAGLRVHIRIGVSPQLQDYVDKSVVRATQTFHNTMLQILVGARQTELRQLRQDLADVEYKWSQHVLDITLKFEQHGALSEQVEDVIAKFRDVLETEMGIAFRELCLEEGERRRKKVQRRPRRKKLPLARGE